MPYYKLRGDWVLGNQYDKDEVVKYASSYYQVKIKFPFTIPTDTVNWMKVTELCHETTVSSDIPYVRSLYTYEMLAATANSDSTVFNMNNNGLFMFPKKKDISTVSDLHFKKMGLEIIYSYAKAYYLANKSLLPTITAIYIVQGTRQKNIVCQGFSVAAVEAVGFKNKFNTGTVEIAQSTKLGNSTTDVAFPVLDGDNLRMFPVLKISKERKGDDNGTFRWRMEQDAVTQLMVMDKEEIMIRPDTVGKSEFNVVASNNDMYNHIADYQSYFDNLKTDKFCVFIPDIILNKSININTNLFIKPVIKVPTYRPPLLPLGTFDQINKYSIHTQLGSRGTGSPSTDPDVDSIYIDTPIFTNQTEMSNRYLNPLKIGYNKLDVQPIASSEINVIQENEVLPNHHGFITRMKSIIEVFGDDMRTADDVDSNTIVQYFNQSRNQSLEAGIMINRTKKSVVDTETYIYPNIMDFASAWKSWPFGSKYIFPFEGEREINSLPLVATNLSMAATPYVGVFMPKKGKYISTATIGMEDTDYRNMNNAIVNLCRYEDIQKYITDVENSYNILNEEYHIIDDDSQWNVTGVATPIFRGDVFSQKTFMRCIRWNGLPNSIKDWEYSWKQGSAFNLYLQSFVNTFLRVPGVDDTFYPYVLSDDNAGAKNTIIDNFIWKSESRRYLKESWSSNMGYNQLKGLMTLYPFDTINLLKSNKSPNRIRFSNSHISGAFMDGYKEFPVDQYQDYAFEQGAINKLIVINSILFSIQNAGINQHYGASRLQSNGDITEIILGDKSILNDNSRSLADYGTQHQESVIQGEAGAYGIDWNREVIWRIKGSSTASGTVVYDVEDLTKTKMVFDIFKTLKENVKVLKQDTYALNPTGIVTAYDEENKQILFTIHLGTKSHTLIFSEQFDSFAGFISYDANYYMKLDKRLFSFAKTPRNTLSTTQMWEHNIGKPLNFHGKQFPLEIDFIINGKSEKDASNYEKEFKGHLINMCPEELNHIEWETEYQYSKKYPFIDNDEFWTNPEYKENVWRLPVLPNQKTTPEGPLNVTEFNTFETNSNMRGQWIKVHLSYTGKNLFFIRNVITNFIISFT